MSEPSLTAIVTTCGSLVEAEHIATELVEKRLAACVQLSQIQSIYRWQGNIEEAREVQLTIKARLSDFNEIEKLILANHSYQNPEVIALPITAGSQAYLDWLSDETRRDIE